MNDYLLKDALSLIDALATEDSVLLIDGMTFTCEDAMEYLLHALGN